jgi:hypothetical protein
MIMVINHSCSDSCCCGGYAADLVANTILNPLGLTGLRYCHLVAVAKYGCGPGFSAYGGLEGVNNAFVAAAEDKVAGYALETGVTVVLNANHDALSARATGFNCGDLYNEYNTLSVQFAQAMAMNRDGAPTVINDETKKAAIMDRQQSQLEAERMHPSCHYYRPQFRHR